MWIVYILGIPLVLVAADGKEYEFGTDVSKNVNHRFKPFTIAKMRTINICSCSYLLGISIKTHLSENGFEHFNRHQFLAFGYRRCLRLSVCACVCGCVCVSVCQSRACPHHSLSPFQARFTKLGPEVQNTLLVILIVLEWLTLIFKVPIVPWSPSSARAYLPTPFIMLGPLTPLNVGALASNIFYYSVLYTDLGHQLYFGF